MRSGIDHPRPFLEVRVGFTGKLHFQVTSLGEVHHVRARAEEPVLDELLNRDLCQIFQPYARPTKLQRCNTYIVSRHPLLDWPKLQGGTVSLNPSTPANPPHSYCERVDVLFLPGLSLGPDRHPERPCAPQDLPQDPPKCACRPELSCSPPANPNKTPVQLQHQGCYKGVPVSILLSVGRLPEPCRNGLV